MKRFRVVDTNFLSDKDWLFKLVDTDGNFAWMLVDESYKRHGVTSPVHKGHLDSLDKGAFIDGDVALLDGRQVIVRVHSWG